MTLSITPSVVVVGCVVRDDHHRNRNRKIVWSRGSRSRRVDGYRTMNIIATLSKTRIRSVHVIVESFGTRLRVGRIAAVLPFIRGPFRPVSGLAARVINNEGLYQNNLHA
jgi:hypothetical protein